MTDEPSEETKVVERVDAVITDLGKGRIRGQKLGELGRAVTNAEMDAKVGRAIGAGRGGGALPFNA